MDPDISSWTSRLEELTGFNFDEFLLLIFFLCVSVYMFIETFSFGSSVARFPRFTSLFVIIACLLLLFQRFLPGPLQTILTSEDSPFEREEFSETNDFEASTAGLADPVDDELDRPLDPIVFSAAALLAYMVIGIAIGFLWVTPVYVAVYLYWFRQSRTVIIVLTITSIIIAFSFMTFINIPIEDGILTEGLVPI